MSHPHSTPASAASVAVLGAARALLERAPRVLLAVSGGVDSMALLHAVAAVGATGERVTVATFDHGTGAHATAAADLVEREARRLGFSCRRGCAASVAASEAAWRAARWRFLRAEAARARATIATAHTRDDQVETVALRILRGAGARGLAGLFADSDIARPFLGLTRRETEAFVAECDVSVAEDPSNRSRRYARNRLRHEILPALRRVRPELDRELLEIAARAADWRREVDALAARLASVTPGGHVLEVERAPLVEHPAEELRTLWPALVARLGVTLDRRGTLRLAEFTRTGAHGGRIQLSGGVEVLRRGEHFVVRRARATAGPEAPCALDGHAAAFGRWRFAPATSGTETLWVADLPADARLAVRRWRPGDRMRSGGPLAARRVKRFFSDARIAGPDRVDWPVVTANDEIVWIPGIRRSDAATVRSGRPVVRYACERHDP